MRLNYCCFCFPLENGSITIGVLVILKSIFKLSRTLQPIVNDQVKNFTECKLHLNSFVLFFFCYSNIIDTFLIFSSIGLVAGLISSILLILGIKKQTDKKRTYRKIKQFLIIYGLTIVGTFIVGFVFCTYVTHLIMRIFVSIIIAVIESYLWFVVFSYYEQFKKEELIP